MTHLFLLRFHILPVILLYRNLQRYSLIDLQPEFTKSINFIRVIDVYKRQLRYRLLPLSLLLQRDVLTVTDEFWKP